MENEWINCYTEDLWIFDKLILSRKLGYICGPKGTPVPEPNFYVIRPCVNLMGMGRGAFVKFLENDTDDIIPDGTFWCELFKGRHLSVDFYKKKQVLCVEGYRDDFKDLSKWNKWEKRQDQIKFPEILKSLIRQYDWINVEMINGNIIEAHLRKNTDFEEHNSEYVIPVYKNDDSAILEGHVYIHSPEHIRLGFLVPKDAI